MLLSSLAEWAAIAQRLVQSQFGTQSLVTMNSFQSHATKLWQRAFPSAQRLCNCSMHQSSRESSGLTDWCWGCNSSCHRHWHTHTHTHTINDSRPTVIFTSCCSPGLSAECADMKSDTITLPPNPSDRGLNSALRTQNVAHETTSHPKPTPSTPQQWNHWQSSNKCPNFHRLYLFLSIRVSSGHNPPFACRGGPLQNSCMRILLLVDKMLLLKVYNPWTKMLIITFCV